MLNIVLSPVQMSYCHLGCSYYNLWCQWYHNLSDEFSQISHKILISLECLIKCKQHCMKMFSSQEQWLQQTAEDPDLQKDPQTVIGENEEIEEISIEVTDDDSDHAGEIGDVELDYNDPIILRLFRVSI